MGKFIDINRPVELRVNLDGRVYHELQVLAARRRKEIPETVRDCIGAGVFIFGVYARGAKIVVEEQDGRKAEVLWGY